MTRICLMGVGNVLMGDDALGPYVLKQIEAGWELPRNVTVFDAGTPGLDLTLFLDGFDALVAVDALKAKGEPGTIKSYGRIGLVSGALPIVTSPHEPSLREALMRLDMIGRCPKDVVLIGAIPQGSETGTGLSEPVQRAIPEIVAQVLRELERLGSPAVPRHAPFTPDVWWEAANVPGRTR
ncbi:MAG TPA: hydrogenase maturation protease [Myxococcales bacterium]|nr:hydrogenase maturation protease [Myxococcales bacterium]